MKVVRLLAVAKLRDNVLLGEDILAKDKTLGPGDVMYSKNMLCLAGHNIPMRTAATQQKAIRLVSLEQEILPAMGDKFIEAFLERPEEEMDGEDSMEVIPNLAAVERYGFIPVAQTLDIRDKISVNVRLGNPYDYPILIPAEVVVAYVEPVEVIRVVQAKENYGEDDNHLSFRKLTFNNQCVSVSGSSGSRAPRPTGHCSGSGGALETTEFETREILARSSIEGAGSAAEAANLARPNTEEAWGLTSSQRMGKQARVTGEEIDSIGPSVRRHWCGHEKGMGPGQEMGTRPVSISPGDSNSKGGPVKTLRVAGRRRVRKRKWSHSFGPHDPVQKVCRVMPSGLEDSTEEGGSMLAEGGRTAPTESNEVASLLAEDGKAVPAVDSADGEDLEVALGKASPKLQELIKRSIAGWSPKQQKDIIRLMLKYRDIFSEDDYDIGRTDLVEHEIDTGDAKPIRSAPRPMPHSMAEGGKEAIDKLLKQGLISPSTSPWSSPIVLVRKKDGRVRLTVDYRKLNAVTQMPASSLPRIQDCVDALAGSAVYSTGDSPAAYWQIPMKKSDVPKTAFITKFGLYEFNVLPMGLCSAPQAFTRLMELALAGLQWTTCVIYLDDVIVFGEDFDQHISRLEAVMERFRKAGLKLKPEKCQFFQREVKFLGYLLSQDGVKPHPDNLEKIKNWPVPKDETDVRAILGMGNYYRRFIKGYSEKVQPLVELTKKDVPFEWKPMHQAAFDRLKAELTGADIVSHPRDKGTFYLDTDASGKTIGCTLSQEQEGREKVIAYGSRTLSRQERNYCVTDRELLAVKYFVDYYKQYLEGRQFIVRTDHQAIKWLFSLKDPKDRIARWLEILSGYTFSIEHRAGKKHGNADAMSRRPCTPNECTCPLLNENEELLLPCGPCRKCLHRSNDMQSHINHSQGPTGHRPQTGGKGCQPQNPKETISMATQTDPVDSGDCTVSIEMSNKDHQISKSVNRSRIKDKGVQVDLEHASKRKRTRVRNMGRAGRRRHACRTPWPPEEPAEPAEVCRRIAAMTQPLDPAGPSTSNNDALSKSAAELRSKQLKDPDIAPVIRWKEAGNRPSGPAIGASSPSTRHYWSNWGLLDLKDGVLFRKFEKRDGTGSYNQLVAPRTIRKEILYHLHKGKLGGHLGCRRTLEHILQNYYWHDIRLDVELYVKMCDECQKVKERNKKARAPLHEMPVGGPLDRVATDILGPLPRSNKGNRYILVASDQFTKWVEILPIPDQLAETIAHCLLNEVFSRFGAPLILHSDQGTNFGSQIIAELCILLEIRKTRTSPGHPSGNGQVERMNRTIIRMIKCFIKGDQLSWDLHLGCLAGAYRRTRHDTTGMTPNLMMLGREIHDIALLTHYVPNAIVGGKEVTPSKWITELRETLVHAHDIAREHSQKAFRRHKAVHDERVVEEKYEIGDLVMYETDRGQWHITKKLRTPYQGPFMVYRTSANGVDYQLCLEGGELSWVHHNKLKRYHGIKFPAGYFKALQAAKAAEAARVTARQAHHSLPVSRVRQRVTA